MKRVLYSVFLSLAALMIAKAQSNATLSGYIKDGSNGETLIGATVFIKELAVGATSNEYGFYSLSVASGTYTVEYSYLGFDSQAREIELQNSLKLDIELGGTAALLEEVVVTSEAKDAECTIKITKEDLVDLAKGDLNPMTAFMTGKIKIDGDMSVAMKLQSLLG